jgi:coenzyme F420-dependent glucose-6-phosphate dehydrogenase
MPEFGCAISAEEHRPNDLVKYAKFAEDAGFSYALVSDHFHPWIDKQGQSPFVWSIIGGIAATTERIRLGTGVTCPTIRIHPAIIAQAAATSAAMMEGRFFLGVGSGENLNEHILGDRWPPAAVRQMMLEEAIDVIRELWSGDQVSYYGAYYTVENARIYTLPEELPPIIVAASGEMAATLAGESGDGLITTSPDPSVIDAFDSAGGDGPKMVQLTVCWDEDEARARKIMHEHWPNSALPGQLSQELALPSLFEQAAQLVTEEAATSSSPCGPDPQKHIQSIKKALDAGFDHVAVHQVGPNQEGFFDFYQREVLPALQ